METLIWVLGGITFTGVGLVWHRGRVAKAAALAAELERTARRNRSLRVIGSPPRGGSIIPDYVELLPITPDAQRV